MNEITSLPELPTWQEIVRIFPVTLHNVALLAFGWWARGRVDQRFIDYLKDREAR